MTGDASDGSWDEWRRLIVHEIKRLNDNLEKTVDRVSNHDSDIVRLKVYSAIYGFCAGVLATVLITKAI